ncbi:MAG: glycosyltransferase family 39 protein [Planctomycetaceae bacterium]|nr:glycosyltransferase family 39 protein [Planctomycetaceae bacterium]
MKRLTALLLAGLVVRVALWTFVDGAPPVIVDAVDYDALARGLIERGSYSDVGGNLISMRPPLYPWLVSVVYRAAGVGNYAAVYGVQIVLSLMTTCIVYRLGRLAYDESIGLAAAALFCFYPSFLAYDNLLLTEVLATFLLTSATLAAAIAVRASSMSLLGLAGVLYGLAALTRSAALMLIPFLAVWLVAFWPGRRAAALAAAVLLVVSFVGTIGPWAYRNTQLQGTLTLIDVMGGRNAMMGNYEHTPLERSWATISVAEGKQSWIHVLRERRPEAFSGRLSQGQVDKLAMREALSYMARHPAQTTQRTSVKIFNFWQLEREIVAGLKQGIWGEVPKIAVVVAALVICGYYAACLFSAIFGAILAPPRWPALQSLFLISIAVPWGAHSLIFAHSRYHLPLVPLLAIYAAAAMTRRDSLISARRSLGFAAATLACVVLACGWIREFLVVDIGHFNA